MVLVVLLRDMNENSMGNYCFIVYLKSTTSRDTLSEEKLGGDYNMKS